MSDFDENPQDLPPPPLLDEELEAIANREEDDTPLEIRPGDISLQRPSEPDSTRISRLREKARALPPTPGVYLMKDCRGVVIYIGKSRSLRDRVGSYFVPSTDLGPTKNLLLDYVADFDTLDCDTEVEALLMENRLIKDTQPRFNACLTDDKTYPYLEITTREDYPGVYVTRQPQASGTKLYGPFIGVSALREAITLLQRAFKFRTCHLEILEEDSRRRYFRPCILHAIKQCTAPCGDRISKEAYHQDIQRLRRFLESKGRDVLREMTAEMEAAAKALDFEKAAVLRDQLKALRSLSARGHDDGTLQPEVFFQDHSTGLRQLQQHLELPEPPRSIECIDIAHFQGEATVGSLVCFIDGKPFKNGYRRFKIKTLKPGEVDDYKSIQEVIGRRYRDAGQNAELYPDIVMIDGGLGQLHAAQAAFAALDSKPPMVISLAKREEEVFIQAKSAPLRLSRTSAALKLLQHVRDEAHRFGQNYHHLLIQKKRFDQDVAEGRTAPATGVAGESGSVTLIRFKRKKKANPAVPPSERAADEEELKIITAEEAAVLGQNKTEPPTAIGGS